MDTDLVWQALFIGSIAAASLSVVGGTFARNAIRSWKNLEDKVNSKKRIDRVTKLTMIMVALCVIHTILGLPYVIWDACGWVVKANYLWFNANLLIFFLIGYFYVSRIDKRVHPYDQEDFYSEYIAEIKKDINYSS